jgi:hypothetical protein
VECVDWCKSLLAAENERIAAVPQRYPRPSRSSCHWSTHAEFQASSLPYLLKVASVGSPSHHSSCICTLVRFRVWNTSSLVTLTAYYINTAVFCILLLYILLFAAKARGNECAERQLNAA